jgi:hypothetical protein
MRSRKSAVILIVVTVVLTYLTVGLVRNWNESREKARLENLLSPAVAKAVEGTPDPKPSLYFVSATDESLVVVLRWDQKPEMSIKNDVRERVMSSVRRELAADSQSWGRHISVIFDDEVVTQGWK